MTRFLLGVLVGVAVMVAWAVTPDARKGWGR